MGDFLINATLWTLALYGFFEIIKTIINMCTYTDLKADGIYLIVAVKNQENNIEMFLRSILFKFFYGKEESVKNIIVADLDSQDYTKEISKKIAKDYDSIKVISWKECKEILDNVNNN